VLKNKNTGVTTLSRKALLPPKESLNKNLKTNPKTKKDKPKNLTKAKRPAPKRTGRLLFQSPVRLKSREHVLQKVGY